MNAMRALHPPRRLVTAITVALLVVVHLVAGATSAVPSASASSPDPGPSAGPALSSGLPPIGDIPYYKVDAARSGVHPGPGPLVPPVEAWRVQLGCAAGGSATGVVGSGSLIVGCDDPRVNAIDVATGHLRWVDDLDGSVEGSAIAGDTVYVADTGGGLTAIDLASGEIAWHVKRDAGGQTRTWSPVVSDGVVYVAGHDGRFVGYDVHDGSETWSWAAADGVRSIGGTVLDGTAYISGDDGYQRAINIADGGEAWSFRTLSDVVSSVSITDDVVFVAAQGAGIVYALDRQTGAEVWRYQSPTGEQVAPPVNADGVVYAASVPDGLVALDARDGSLVWRTTVGSVGGQSPAIAGEAIYQETQRGVGAYSRTDGSQLWSIDLGANLNASALVTGGMVIVTDDHGLVHAFVDPSLLPYFATPPPSPEAASTPPTATVLPELLTLTATFDAGSSDLAHPTGMAAGPDGNLYVVNSETSEILVLDPASGAVIRRWGGPGSDAGQFSFVRNADPDNFDAVGAVGVGSDGDVYVSDTYNRRIQQFTSDGAFVRQWGRFGSDDGQFLEAVDLAVGPDGSVYVLDPARSDIQRFTPEGEFVGTIGEFGTGPGQISNGLGGITVGQDGTVYYTDFDNSRLEAWNADGTFAWMISGDGTSNGLSFPADIAVDDAGRMFVSDGPLEVAGRRVSTYDRDRTLLGSWIATGPSNALALSGGNLYVGYYFTSQVAKLDITDE